MTIIEQINDGIKESMRSKDSIRLNTLRMLKSKIMSVDARANLPDAEVLKLFKSYLGMLEEALEHAKNANQAEACEKLEKEMVIVHEFLPKALSREETKKIVVQAIHDSQTTSKKGLGLVMKRTMQLNNTVDGKLAKEIASELLPD